MNSKIVAMAALLAVGLAGLAPGDTHTFDGGCTPECNDQSWSLGTNWDPTGPPGCSDIAVIPYVHCDVDESDKEIASLRLSGSRTLYLNEFEVRVTGMFNVYDPGNIVTETGVVCCEYVRVVDDSVLSVSSGAQVVTQNTPDCGGCPE